MNCRAFFPPSLLLVLLLLVRDVFSARILAILLVPATSHTAWYSAYLNALRERGHSVTFVGVDRVPGDIRHVIFEGLRDELFPKDYMLEHAGAGPMETTLVLDQWDHSISNHIKKSDEFQQLLTILRTERFDLVVHDLGACAFMLASVQLLGDPPVLGVAPFSPSWIFDILKNPIFQASHPHYLAPYGEEMSFFERVHNYLIHAFSWATRTLYMIEQNRHAKDAFGDGLRPLEETFKRMNVILVNSQEGIDFAYPKAPGLIHVGGLHIAPVKPLPKDLQAFLDGATSGFVYFSLGTNILTSSLNREKMEMFANAFRQLSPVRILWKWERGDPPNVPENVKLIKWAPQNDVLAHERIRLFVSHCGRLSMQEAVHHGVPVLGMPFALDQPANLKKCIDRGVAEELDYRSLTAEGVLEKLRKMLSDSRYRENARKLSAVVRDRPEAPLDRAVFWTEHVVRHGGAPHLGLFARKMMWYENAQLDVYLFFLLVLLYVLFIAYKILQFLARKLRKEDIKPKRS